LTALVAGLTLVAVGNLAIRLDGLSEQIAGVQDAADESNERLGEGFDDAIKLHRITRQYIGNALIEQKVLPLLGYKKPERSAFEKQALAEIAADPDFN
jgi:hypothetical protein